MNIRGCSPWLAYIFLLFSVRVPFTARRRAPLQAKRRNGNNGVVVREQTSFSIITRCPYGTITVLRAPSRRSLVVIAKWHWRALRRCPNRVIVIRLQRVLRYETLAAVSLPYVLQLLQLPFRIGLYIINNSVASGVTIKRLV